MAATRKVRFASHLEPPFTDADAERYFWQQFHVEEEESHFDRELLKLCILLFGIIAVCSVSIIVIYFAFKDHGK